MLSELALPHLSLGIIIGPPLEVKGGFSDIVKFKWLAQGKSVNTSALANSCFDLCCERDQFLQWRM